MTDLKTKIAMFLAGAAVVGGGIGAGMLMEDAPAPLLDKTVFEVIEWQKPTTDADWAKDTTLENLDLKTDEQLAEMKESHERKLAKFEEQIDDLNRCPECRRIELEKNMLSSLIQELGTSSAQVEVDAQFAEGVENLKWEYEKLKQSVERINKEIELRAKGYVVTDKIGTKDDLKPRKASELRDIPPERVRKLNP